MTITLMADHEYAAEYLANGTVQVQGFDVETGWPEGGAAAVYPRLFTDLENDATAYLRDKQAQLESRGVEVASTVRAGYPAAHIIDFAEDSAGSVIVMSTHGRGGLGRWILGSVADRVLRAAYRPILLIRSG